MGGRLGKGMSETQEEIRAMASSLTEARSALLTGGQIRALVRDEMTAVCEKLGNLQ